MTARKHAPSPEPRTKQKSGLVRRVTRSALLAISLTAAQVGTDDDELAERMFDPHLLDRLKAPLTRYHE